MTSETAVPASGDTVHPGGAPRDSLPLILLVEDEPTTRLIMSRQLSRAGYEVEAVANGMQAVSMLKNKHFSLLLTDWDMPEMNGLTLCKTVREMPLEGYVYIILLTAREGKANIIEGLAAGADDYLTKPPDDHELRARLNTGRRILRLEQSLRAANQQVHLLSVTDALTATYNRRYLAERWPPEKERASRHRRPLSVILCDLDHFKRVNDEHGHQAGDEVLVAFGQILLRSIRREIDWVVRYGGEEFLIVLPETALAQALRVAERIRRSIEAHSFPIAGSTLKLTSSFGVAGYESSAATDGGPMNDLIADADLCLYRSKETGRNRVTSNP